MYYEQGGQLLYLQIQRSRDSGGDEYGELEVHFLSRKKEPLQTHDSEDIGALYVVLLQSWSRSSANGDLYSESYLFVLSQTSCDVRIGELRSRGKKRNAAGTYNASNEEQIDEKRGSSYFSYIPYAQAPRGGGRVAYEKWAFCILGQTLLDVRHFSKVQCELIQFEKWNVRWIFRIKTRDGLVQVICDRI